MTGLGDIRFVRYQELLDGSNLVHRDRFSRASLENTLGSGFFLLSVMVVGETLVSGGSDKSAPKSSL